MEITLDDLSKSQENLLKNHSNPVFNQKDRDKILKKFIDLQNIVKSLHRYRKLNKNNYLQNAQEEKENIETIILKGGISYNKYIWHSENSENTCDVCKSLDGKEFDFFDEVPERPHPNCRCTVVVVENNEEYSFQESDINEEPCDIIEHVDDLINKMERAKDEISTHIEDLKSDIHDFENDIERVTKLIQVNDLTLKILSEDYGRHLSDCENNIDMSFEKASYKQITLNMLLNDLKQLLSMGWKGLGTFVIFASNYVALLGRAYILKQYEMDKYYHSKANCEAVQAYGDLGEKAAILLSDTKENFDQWNNIYAKSHKVTIEEAIADSERDQSANKLGRERGRKYPNCKCYELMSDLKPKHKK